MTVPARGRSDGDATEVAFDARPLRRARSVTDRTRSQPFEVAAGRRTVAEFVPDQETLELLESFGVDLAQGFHIGRPRPVEELL